MNQATKVFYGSLAVVGVLVVGWLAYRQSLPLGPAGLGAAPSAPTLRQQLPPLSEVVEQHPALGAAFAALGQGDPDEARRQLGSVPPDHPAVLYAINSLAALDEREGNLEPALAHLERLIAAYPEMPGLWRRLSTVNYKLGRYDRSEWATLRLLELLPGHMPSRYDVALFRLAQGRVGEAVSSYVRAMQYPGAEGEQRFHALQAFEELQRFQTRHPEMQQVHYVLAFFANSIGKTDREVRELELFLEAEAESPLADQAREQLTQARQRAGGTAGS